MYDLYMFEYIKNMLIPSAFSLKCILWMLAIGLFLGAFIIFGFLWGFIISLFILTPLTVAIDDFIDFVY